MPIYRKVHVDKVPRPQMVPGVCLRPGVYKLYGQASPRRIIEAGVHSREAWKYSTCTWHAHCIYTLSVARSYIFYITLSNILAMDYHTYVRTLSPRSCDNEQLF